MTGEQDFLTDTEYDYIINALSFKPGGGPDQVVTLEELQYWLAPGPPMMV